MKKLTFILALMTLCTFSVCAATYKINSSGTMTAPSGTQQRVKKSSTSRTIQNSQVFNTYTTQNYTNNTQSYVGQASVVDIVMDYSGSMSSWVDVMERSMITIVNQLPTNIKLGMRVAGFGRITKTDAGTVQQYSGGKYTFKKGKSTVLARGGSCTSSEVVMPIGDTTSAQSILGSIATGGATPLVYALRQAVTKDFQAYGFNEPKKIILITDGGETCGGDPCEFADNLASMRKDITVDVVLVSWDRSFQCVADRTGGRVYNPSTISNLPNIIINSATTPITKTQQQYQQPQQPVVQPTPKPSNIQNYEYIPN